jgi:hypothetical protein
VGIDEWVFDLLPVALNQLLNPAGLENQRYRRVRSQGMESASTS